MSSKTPPLLLTLGLEAALILPGFGTLQPSKDISGMFKTLLGLRTDYYMHGRVDMFALWRVIEAMVFMPWGLTENEIR